MAGKRAPYSAELAEANELVRRGDDEAAVRLLQRILEQDRTQPDALNNLAMVRRRQGRSEEAIHLLLQAQQSRHAQPEVHANLAGLLVDQHREDEAVWHFLRAAESYRDRRRYKDAVRAALRAGKLSPANLGARQALAVACLRLADYGEALKHLEEARTVAGRLATYARFMAEGRSVAEIVVAGETLRYRVLPGVANMGIAFFHANGLVFEEAELAFCAQRVPPGGVIVDVGANVGNHLVYFAKLLRPARIIAIEPHPEAAAQLRDNVALNGLACADLSLLGKGAGSSRGRFHFASENIDLAQVALRPDGEGEIEVLPLDALIDARVDFIKIDTEGMECEVLAGARGILERDRPLLMVEVSRDNVARYDGLMSELGYVTERRFRHEGYANCFCAPLQGRPA